MFQSEMEQSFWRRHFRLLFILMGASIFAKFVAISYLPLMPIISRKFQVSPHFMQLTVTAYNGGMALVQVIAGVFSEYYGRRKAFLVGASLTTLCCLLMGLSQNFTQFIVLIFIEAVGVGFLLPIQSAIVKDAFEPEDETRTFSLINIALFSAAIIAPVMGGFIGAFLGWRWLFYFLVLIGVIGFVISYFLLVESHQQFKLPPHERTVLFTFRDIFTSFRLFFKNRNFILGAVVGGIILSCQTIFNTAVPFVFDHTLHMRPHIIGLFMMLPSGGYILGLVFSNIVKKYLSNLWGIFLSIVGALLLGVLSMILGFMGIVTAWVITLPIVVLFFFVGVATPFFWITALKSFAHIAAIAASYVIFFQYIFSAIVSAIMSLLDERSQGPMGVMFVILTLISTVITLCVMRAERRAS